MITHKTANREWKQRMATDRVDRLVRPVRWRDDRGWPCVCWSSGCVVDIAEWRSACCQNPCPGDGALLLLTWCPPPQAVGRVWWPPSCDARCARWTTMNQSRSQPSCTPAAATQCDILTNILYTSHTSRQPLKQLTQATLFSQFYQLTFRN